MHLKRDNNMKKLLLGLALLFPLQTVSADDSVYTWGKWSDGVQPAAGPVVSVASPTPAQTPSTNFRPYENSAFHRDARIVQIPSHVSLPPATQGAAVTIISTTNTSDGRSSSRSR